MADAPAEAEPAVLKDALAACRDLVAWAALFSVAVNVLFLTPSLYMLQIYDRVLRAGGITTLGFLSLILVFALGTLAFLDMTRARLMGRLSLRLDRLLAPVLLEAALNRTEKAPQRNILRSFDSLRAAVTGPTLSAFLDAPWSPIYVIVCFLFHPLIGLLTLLGGALLVAVAIRNERAQRAHLAQAGELLPRMYAAQEAEEAAGEAARALGMRRALIRRQLGRRAAINDVQAGAQFEGAKYASLTRFVRLLLQSAVLGVGAWLAVERQLSPGALIAGSILAARALAPLEQIVGAWRQIGEARLAYKSIRETLASALATTERTALPPPKGDLSLERIAVRLDPERFALQDVRLTLAPGEILGIIGPSGAGKSTLARVAAGALAPDHGVVRLDGADIQHWDADALGRHVGYLPQTVSLLSGTIAENIRRFAARDASVDEAVIAAGQQAGAHDMILRLPDGYDTELALGGAGLSLGQLQRVALARALFGSPALLVLDEPNAHLDQDGESSLTEALKTAKARGAMILLVAHRAGILALADRLGVMRDGRIDMIGPREEVATKLASAGTRGKSPQGARA